MNPFRMQFFSFSIPMLFPLSSVQIFFWAPCFEHLTRFIIIIPTYAQTTFEQLTRFIIIIPTYAQTTFEHLTRFIIIIPTYAQTTFSIKLILKLLYAV